MSAINYGKSFERKVIAAMYRSPEFRARTLDRTFTTDFIDLPSQYAVYWLHYYRDNYATVDTPVPAYETFLRWRAAAIENDYPEKERAGVELEFQQLEFQLFGGELLVDIQVVEAEYKSWLVRARARDAIQKAAQQLTVDPEAFDPGEVGSELMAIDQDVMSADDTTAVHKDIALTLDDWETTTRLVYPFNARQLDSTIGGGGGAGELMVIGAPPHVGKTTFLVWMLCQMLLQGYSVLLVTLEEDKRQIMERIASCLLGVPRSQTRLHRTLFQSLLEQCFAFGARLHIVDTSAYAVTTAGLTEAWKRATYVDGTAPQIVMVDYLDLVRPMENHRDYRLNIAQAYREFRAFLKSMQVFGVSPTQLNKTAHDLETPDMQHLAECFDKAAIADFLVLLGQTKKQRQEQRMGLFFAKNRAGKRDMMVDMAVDYDRNRFDAYGEPRFVLEEGLNEVTARATVHQTGGVIPVPTAYASALQNANPPSAVYDPTAVPPSAVL